MSKFESHIQNILSGKIKIPAVKSSTGTTKTASSEVKSDITVESLRKIATILRNTKAEPSYEDLAKFVDRIV